MSKTVRVRIAVAVGSGGDWCAHGADGESDRRLANDARCMLEPGQQAGAHVRWVEADVPLPEAVAVEGEVKA